MAVAREFIVKLLADTTAFEKSFGALGPKIQKTLGGAEADIKKIGPAFATVAAASAATFAGIAAFATSATQAAIEDQAEQEKLAQTLRNVTGATDEAVVATESFVAGLAKTTTFSDSQLRPALSSLVVATGDVTRAQELLTTAQDISVATGTDLQQVSDALAKASNGNNKALQSLSPTLRDNIKEGQSFNQVLRELQTNFGGAAQAAAGTLSGQITILRNRFDEIKESIGQAFLPILEVLVAVLGKVATFIENNTTLFTFLIVAVGTITGQITLLIGAFVTYKAAMALASAANILFGATLTATGIGAIIVLIGLLVAALVTFVAKMGGVSNAAKAMANFVIGAFESLVNNAIGALNFLIDKVNFVIRGMQKVGISVEEIGPIAEVSFGRFETSVKEAGGRLSIFNSQLATTTGNMIRFESGIKAESRARLASNGALDEYNKKIREQLRSTGGAAEKTQTAAEKLKEYTSVLKSAQSASKSFGDAQKRTSNAKQSLADAVKAEAKAQQDLLKAQQSGSPAEIADAQRAVAAAERGLARAKFGQEEAIIAVRDAEKKLADIRKDPEATADDIRRAEIALAEAKFAVADAEDNQIQVTNNLTEARRQLRIATEGLREGDAELIPFQDAVTKAKIDSKNAADAFTEALERETEALDNYKEALEALGEVAEKFPKIAERVGGPGLIPTVPAAVTPQPSTAAAAAGVKNSPINIIVQSGVLNGAQVGEEIYQYLRDYERVNGPLNFMV